MSWSTFFYIIGLMFVLELPDKTMIATVIMAARARPLPVAVGASIGFTVHMALAVALGSLLGKLPATPKEIVVGLLFAFGAYYLLFHSEEEEIEKGEEEAEPEHRSVWLKEALTAFTVIFIGEFGDLTQIQAANLSAKYHQPLTVFAASSIALVAIAFFGAYGGRTIQKFIPLKALRIAGGVIFAALAIVTFFSLFK
jgi:putative Ca2+/H+ antiporter (TMEM165/GDT1 family)